MIIIENEYLIAKIHPKGAELQSLIHKINNTEIMWQANPTYWAKHSPILFPIVGSLKNGAYHYNNKSYQLPRHGFAREMEFESEKISNTEAVFTLKSSTITLEKYPFQFLLEVNYSLVENKLVCGYTVTNSDTEQIYFSLGAHPAFNIATENNAFTDYQLHFNKEEQITRHKLTTDGLISSQTKIINLTNGFLPLQHELFTEDAIVAKNLKSDTITVSKIEDEKSIFSFSWHNLPHFGIWQPKNAPFLCLEPWQGFADTEKHNGKLTEKEGIIKLEVSQNWQANWSVMVNR